MICVLWSKVLHAIFELFHQKKRKKKIRFVTPFKWWWSFILHVVNKFSHMLELLTSSLWNYKNFDENCFGNHAVWKNFRDCHMVHRKIFSIDFAKTHWEPKGHFNQKCQHTDKYLSVKRQVVVNDSLQQTKYYWPMVTTTFFSSSVLFFVNSIDKRSFHEKKKGFWSKITLRYTSTFFLCWCLLYKV